MGKIFNVKKLINILLPLLFILLGNIFVLNFKMNEKFIYYWDISGYWINCMDFTELLSNDSGAAFKQLYESILYQDYTLLPVLFYVPIFKLFSQTNLAFVLTTYNLFGISYMLLMYVFLIKQFNLEKLYEKAIVLFILFTFNVLLTPIMGGYLDVVGLTFIAMILLLVQSFDMTKVNLQKCVCLSLLVLITCFLRRWYSFWIVNFFIAYFLCKVIENRKSLFNGKKIINIFLNLFISGALWLLILLAFFREFIINLISNNLSFAYSAYDFGGIGYNLSFILSQFGLLLLVLSLVGAIMSFIDSSKRFYTSFLLLQNLLMIMMFTNMQSLGIQHLLLFVPSAIYFLVYCVLNLPKLFKNFGIPVYTLLLILIGLNFSNSYFRHNNPIISAIDPILSQKKLYRRTRNDIESIQAMVDFINEVSADKKYTYILSSSGVLNSDILKNAYLPAKKNAIDKMFYTLDVDKRDGFPFSFYMADIIVTTTPIQYHLNPDDQRIIGLLAKAIETSSQEEDSPLELINTFELDEDVIAYIYEKKAPYSHKFIADINTSFAEIYPDLDFLSNTISIYSYMYNLNLQQGKNIILNNNNTMGMEIGEENAGFSINTSKAFEKISFNIIANYDVEDNSMIGKKLLITDNIGNIIGDSPILSGENYYEIDVHNIENMKFTVISEKSGLKDIYITISDMILK